MSHPFLPAVLAAILAPCAAPIPAAQKPMPAPTRDVGIVGADSKARYEAHYDVERRRLRERSRRRWESLIALENRAGTTGAIDSIRGLSPEDKEFLRRRHRILCPLD